MRNRIRLVLGMLACFAACLAWGPAFGQLVTTTYGPFTVNCNSVGELCDNSFSQSVATVSNLQVEYVASAGHCSPVRVHIFVDGVERAVTAFLNPGEASGFVDFSPVASGNHIVALQGEGTVAGCNAGTLANWGGTMPVITDSVAAAKAAAIPTLSPPLLSVLAATLMLAAGFVVRRRR